MTDLPFVSVIVVNFNGRQYLAECLDSLIYQSYPRHRLEVIVIDNGSTDGSVTLIREQYPWVQLIEADRNLGFAAANNLGFDQSRGDWIALLNNDAAADPDWLTASVAVGERNSAI